MQPQTNAFPESAQLDTFLRQVLSPGLFFVKSDHQLIFHSLKNETITWEIFRGQLLDARHTREQQSFLTYHVGIKATNAGTEAPLLTIRISPSTRDPSPPTLHVTRWLHCRVWEAFDDIGAIGSREVERWVEELVGCVFLAEFNDTDSLMHDLRLLVFHAFVGLSRLPLNSVEAPLPGFSLGVVGFFPGLEEASACVSEPFALLDRPAVRSQVSRLEESKLLELFLRTAPASELPKAAEAFVRGWQERSEADASLGARLRRLFNEISLTPYTDFVPKALTFARVLFEQAGLSLDHYAGFLFGQIRQTVYHLTAYDLITFHHQGANYPDALLLDALLHDVLKLANSYPELFLTVPNSDAPAITRRSRRRGALLLGWWLHRSLTGLLVPDEPTSPGENTRILPPPHRRIPEEQLQQPRKRTRRLFADSPIDWQSHQVLLDACLEELTDPEMLFELGTALYLDRPFGTTKPPAALDLTPLLSYELFSRTVARERLNRINQLEPSPQSNAILATALKRLEEMQVPGLSIPRSVSVSQTVRLQDCWRVADDFIVRRPTPETVLQLRAYFDWDNCQGPLRDWHEQGLMPIPLPGLRPDASSRIAFYDSGWNLQVECTVAADQGFRRRGALELPMPGLEVIRDGVRVIIKIRFP